MVGCNPGLVSHFIRAALDDIVMSVLGGLSEHATPSGKHLGELLATGQYPQIAKLLGLKVVHISEVDSQTSSRLVLFHLFSLTTLLLVVYCCSFVGVCCCCIYRKKNPGEFINTWSPMGFAEEALDWVQVGWGTHEKLPRAALIPDDGERHQIFIPMHAMNLQLNSYVPDMPIVGMCIPHGESESMVRYLTVREDIDNEPPLRDQQGTQHAKSTYRPSVYYVYHCADIAYQSLQEIRENGYEPQANYEVLTNRHNIVGEDRVGCLLMFEDHPIKVINSQVDGMVGKKRPWAYWYGSILGSHDNPVAYCNPTVVQVAASVVSALQWALDNPNKGICWPEMLPHKEILDKAQGYVVFTSPTNHKSALVGLLLQQYYLYGSKLCPLEFSLLSEQH